MSSGRPVLSETWGPEAEPSRVERGRAPLTGRERTRPTPLPPNLKSSGTACGVPCLARAPPDLPSAGLRPRYRVAGSHHLQARAPAIPCLCSADPGTLTDAPGSSWREEALQRQQIIMKYKTSLLRNSATPPATVCVTGTSSAAIYSCPHPSRPAQPRQVSCDPRAPVRPAAQGGTWRLNAGDASVGVQGGTCGRAGHHPAGLRLPRRPRISRQSAGEAAEPAKPRRARTQHRGAGCGCRGARGFSGA